MSGNNAARKPMPASEEARHILPDEQLDTPGYHSRERR